MTIARVRKFLVALVGFAGEVVAAGVLTGQQERWVTAAIGALGALGVYAIPNAHPVAVRKPRRRVRRRAAAPVVVPPTDGDGGI